MRRWSVPVLLAGVLLLPLAWGGRGPGKPVAPAPACRRVEILAKDSPAYLEVSEAIRRELGPKFCTHETRFRREESFESLSARVAPQKPELMVLMDNEGVDFGVRFNASSKSPVPCVAIMGLNFKSLLKSNRWISGIAYESPAFSLVTQFRYVVGRPVRNVLAIYRRSLFSEMVDSAVSQLKLEGITLDAVNAEEQGSANDQVAEALRKGLARMSESPGRYDAVWVLLDSELLSQSLFTSIWIPAARKSGIPFITGSDVLVSREMEFATFAVTPNHPDLAAQAAQQVEQILQSHIKPSEIGVENVVSVNKVLNMPLAARIGLPIRPDRLGDVKRVE